MKLNLIPDEEIDSLEDKDLLGTMPYVQTLNEIVKNCDTPFNIGLLAGWGGGKSSIIETLLKQIRTDNKGKKKSEVEVFKYDAWKYSEDPFRRTFIIQLLEEFKVKGFENLDSLLYDNSSTETEGQTKFNGNKLLKYIFLAPIVLLFIWCTNQSETAKIVVTSGAFISGLGLFLMKELFTTYKITIHKSKIIEPEKFELIFEEIIDEILKQKRSIWKWVQGAVGIGTDEKSKKIVIVIDNIDRCHEELVVQLLLTIKNFLDKKKVVFVLPIDEKGVTYFLQNSNQDATEFLRKIFNATIRIKSFSNDEMFDFSWQLVQDYQLENVGVNREVVQLACQEYTSNPRKIIQFLNNFQMEIYLVTEQEKANYLKDNQVSNNFEFLAKLSIIREEWPKLYISIFDRHHLLSQIDTAIVESKFTEKDKVYKVPGDNDIPDLDERQYLFFRRTRGIQPNGSVEPFMVNRDLLKDIPDILNEHISGSNWAKIKESINNEELTFVQLLDSVKKRFDVDINKRKLYTSTGVAIFSLVNQIIIDEEFNHQFDSYYNRNECRFLNQLISSSEFTIELKKMTSNEIIPLTKWLSAKKDINLRNKVIELINGSSNNETDSTHFELIIAFIEAFGADVSLLKKVSKRFSDIITAQPQLVDSIETILDDSTKFKNLITNETLGSYIDVVNAETIQNEQNRIKLIRTALNHDKLTQIQIDKYISNVIPNLNNNAFEALQKVYNSIEGFIIKTENTEIHTAFYSMMQNRMNLLIQQLNSGQINEPHLSCYKSQIGLLGELSLVSESYRPTCISWINQIVSSQKIDEITTCALRIYDNLIEFQFDFLPNINQCYVQALETSTKELAFDAALKEINTQEEVGDTSFSPIFENYITYFFSSPDTVGISFVNFIDEVATKQNLKDFITNRVNNITNSDNRNNFLKLVDRLKTKSIAGNLISNIINETRENPIFAVNIQYVIDNYSDGKKAVNEILIDSLKEEEDVERLKILIALVFDNKGILHKSMLNAAITELRQYLVSKDIVELRFALQTLDKLNKTDLNNTILRWLLPLLKEPGVDLEGADLELQKQIIEAFK